LFATTVNDVIHTCTVEFPETRPQPNGRKDTTHKSHQVILLPLAEETFEPIKNVIFNGSDPFSCNSCLPIVHASIQYNVHFDSMEITLEYLQG
jgi:hypothetical protein